MALQDYYNTENNIADYLIGEYEDGPYKPGQSFTAISSYNISDIKTLLYRDGNPGILTAEIYKAAILEKNNEDESVDWSTSVFDGANKAQTFLQWGTLTLTGAKVFGKRYYSESTGTLTLAIHAVDESGKPTGAALASGTLSINSLTTDWPGAWIEVTFNVSYEVTGGVKYALIMSTSGLSGEGGEDEFDALCIRGTNSNEYENGAAYSYSAGNWRLFTTGWDFLFETLGELDSEHLPTGDAVATGTLDISSITENPEGEWVDVTFSPTYSIIESGIYVIVLSITGNFQTLYWCQRSAATEGYEGGKACVFDPGGGEWAHYANEGETSFVDFMFECYGGLPPGKARYPTPADDADNVIISGIDTLKYLQWEAPE